MLMWKLSLNKTYLFSRIVIAVLFVSVLFGQFIRLEIGGQASGGLLLTDIVVLALAIWTAIETIWKRDIKWSWDWKSPMLWLAIWVGIAGVSWLINASGYSPKQALVGLAYLIRIVSYILVGLWIKRMYQVLIIKKENFRIENDFVRYFAFMVVVSLFIGGLILVILPDFAALAAMGWDPHVGRLTSTWLDPNYYGSFLALVFAFFLALLAKVRREGGKFVKSQLPYVIILLLSWMGVYLTYSRSALVTFLVAGLTVAIFLSWRYILLVLLMLGSIVAMPSRLQARLGDTVAYSVQQVASVTSENGVNDDTTNAAPADPTANDRINSWKRAFQLFKTSPVIGVGYNMYGYALEKNNILSSETVETNRASSGSDSSIMTVLATTGILGFVTFIMFCLMLIRRLFINRHTSYFVLGALAWLMGWFASSMLNNTLFYVLLLVPSVLILTIAYISIQRLGIKS